MSLLLTSPGSTFPSLSSDVRVRVRMRYGCAQACAFGCVCVCETMNPIERERLPVFFFVVVFCFS